MIEVVQTERLTLRPITLKDVDLLVELDSDPEVMRYITGRPSTRAEVEEVVRQRLGSRWNAPERTSTRFVGWFGPASTAAVTGEHYPIVELIEDSLGNRFVPTEEQQTGSSFWRTTSSPLP